MSYSEQLREHWTGQKQCISSYQRASGACRKVTVGKFPRHFLWLKCPAACVLRHRKVADNFSISTFEYISVATRLLQEPAGFTSFSFIECVKILDTHRLRPFQPLQKNLVSGYCRTPIITKVIIITNNNNNNNNNNNYYYNHDIYSAIINDAKPYVSVHFGVILTKVGQRQVSASS